ncbi:MAG: hypothetical protein F6J87_13105 [Spirulina sp. SIO3F2]|nr:hypothetical protein [Spirulina sp. SIO3F2]
MQYRRLTDHNPGLIEKNTQTSLDLRFCLSSKGDVCFEGRVLDAEENILFKSRDLESFFPDSPSQTSWNPQKSLQAFIDFIESHDTIAWMEAETFRASLMGLQLTAYGPVAVKTELKVCADTKSG